jgi:hypothetical protein
MDRGSKSLWQVIYEQPSTQAIPDRKQTGESCVRLSLLFR